MHPELESGIMWVKCIYDSSPEVTNYLNAQSKMVWSQRKDKITALVKGVLGENFLMEGSFVQKMERSDKLHAFINLLPSKEIQPIEVGTVKVKGLKIPMINHKGVWLVDLPLLVELYKEYL